MNRDDKKVMKKDIYEKLKEEFSGRVSKKTMGVVVFLLWDPKDWAQREAYFLELLKDPDNGFFGKDEKQFMYDLILDTARSMCRDKKFLQAANTLAPKITDAISQVRASKQSRNTVADGEPAAKRYRKSIVVK